MTNKSKNFYHHIGPVFGSREVERATGDRFYDDDDKVWYLYYDSGKPNVFVSIKNNVIKNVWAEKRSNLIDVLKQILKEKQIQISVVPKIFLKEYEEAGYEILEEEKVKFIEIRGGYNE